MSAWSVSSLVHRQRRIFKNKLPEVSLKDDEIYWYKWNKFIIIDLIIFFLKAFTVCSPPLHPVVEIPLFFPFLFYLPNFLTFEGSILQSVEFHWWILLHSHPSSSRVPPVYSQYLQCWNQEGVVRIVEFKYQELSPLGTKYRTDIWGL